MSTPSSSLLIQPKFDSRIFTLAFPLTGDTAGTIQRGYMIWDSATAPTQYGGALATIQYLYNPSTVASDYNIASASAQAAYDFPNPGDAAALAIPLSQTVQWSLMFDRTFELWGNYAADGTPSNIFNGSNDPSSIGVQADVMQFMQFTGMFISSQYTTNGQGGLTAAASYSTSQTGIMQMIPAWAYFGQSNITNSLMYYGYISEWSVQYCVDEETEILTQRGWVTHDNLISDDLCLGIDPGTHDITWQPVQSVHRFRNDQPLMKWTNAFGFNALTTLNHRWLSADNPGEFIQTYEVTGAQRRIIIGGGAPECLASEPSHPDELVELIGWAVTEGSYPKKAKSVRIGQSHKVNPEKTERIRQLAKYFTETGFKVSEYVTDDGMTLFNFCADLGKLVRSIAPDRQLTPEFLCSLTKKQAMLLFDTLIDADGHWGSSVRFTQKDQGRIDGFQMLCAMLGRRSCAKPHKGTSVKDTTVYEKNVTTGRYLTSELEDHHGIVWCPKTPTNTWLARRNGGTFWTGNTHWTQYDIPMRCVISVSFTMLPWPSTQPSQNASSSVYSVLPTPTGNPGITNVTNPGQTTVLPTTGVGGR